MWSQQLWQKALTNSYSFAVSYLCETGFSAIATIKNQISITNKPGEVNAGDSFTNFFKI